MKRGMSEMKEMLASLLAAKGLMEIPTRSQEIEDPPAFGNLPTTPTPNPPDPLNTEETSMMRPQIEPSPDNRSPATMMNETHQPTLSDLSKSIDELRSNCVEGRSERADLTWDSPYLLESDSQTELMDDDDDEEEEHLHQTLEESPTPVGDGFADPILAKEPISLVAHQVLDEMSAPMESTNKEETHYQPVFDSGIINTRVDEFILITEKVSTGSKRFREGNSSIVRVAIFDCSELLSFDPRGDYLAASKHGLLKEVPRPWVDNQIITKGFVSLLARQSLDEMRVSSLQSSLVGSWPNHEKESDDKIGDVTVFSYTGALLLGKGSSELKPVLVGNEDWKCTHVKLSVVIDMIPACSFDTNDYQSDLHAPTPYKIKVSPQLDPLVLHLLVVANVRRYGDTLALIVLAAGLKKCQAMPLLIYAMNEKHRWSFKCSNSCCEMMIFDPGGKEVTLGNQMMYLPNRDECNIQLMVRILCAHLAAQLEPPTELERAWSPRGLNFRKWKISWGERLEEMLSGGSSHELWSVFAGERELRCPHVQLSVKTYLFEAYQHSKGILIFYHEGKWGGDKILKRKPRPAEIANLKGDRDYFTAQFSSSADPTEVDVHQFAQLNPLVEPLEVWFLKELQHVTTHDDKGQFIGLICDAKGQIMRPDKCSYPFFELIIFYPGGEELLTAGCPLDMRINDQENDDFQSVDKELANIRFMVATGCPCLINSLPALLLNMLLLFYRELATKCNEGATSFVFHPGGQSEIDHIGCWCHINLIIEDNDL